MVRAVRTPIVVRLKSVVWIMSSAVLTDEQIAVLCDLGQASSFDAEKKAEVLDLVVRGYVEKDGDLFMGDIAAGMLPTAVMRSASAAVASARFVSVFRRVTISPGVPVGA